MAKSRQKERIKRNDEDDDLIYSFLYIIKKYCPFLMNEFRAANSLAEVSIDTTVDCPKPAKLKDSLGHPL